MVTACAILTLLDYTLWAAGCRNCDRWQPTVLVAYPSPPFILSPATVQRDPGWFAEAHGVLATRL